MSSSAAVIAIVVVGGIAGALQSQFVGVMEDNLGTLGSTLVTYGGGGLVAGLVFLAMRGTSLGEVREVPWWALTAGLLGLVVIASLSIAVSSIGVARTLTVFTASSIIFAALIDQVGLLTSTGRQLDAARLGGVVLVLVGTWLVVRT